MSQVNGKNVVLYQQDEDTTITLDVVDNMDGTQTVTVNWGDKPTGTLLTLIGYNDGSWHDIPVVGTHSASVVITTGSYSYRLTFTRAAPYSHLVYSLPTTIQTWKPYACARTVSINMTTDLIETSVSGSGTWRTYKPTANSWSASIEGIVHIDEEGKITLEELRAKQILQERLYIKYQRVDDDGNEYNEYGYAYITSSDDTGSINDMATFSIELKGSGQLTQSESES